VWPEVISRDDAGNATVRAVRLDGPLDVDGNLDEPVYAEVPPLTGNIQSIPDEGQPATELTEYWITYDEENIYVSARVHEEVPESEWTANEMRRDGNQITQNENFAVIFDSFHDKRNGIMFQTNPLGALRDTMSTDEGNQNQDWNTVWEVRTQRSDQGWTAEISIPFKSLRYGQGRQQTWGVNLRRVVRWKNEWSFLSPLPAYLGPRSIIMTSLAATMVGLEVPANHGLFDGLGAEATASSAELAKLIQAPVVLLVDCTKATRSVAAMVLGCQRMDPAVNLAGVILNRVSGYRHERAVRTAVEQICDLPVLGALPRLADLEFPERHLGLFTPAEHPEVANLFVTAREAVDEHLLCEVLADGERRPR
jgi:hypothetical protein